MRPTPPRPPAPSGPPVPDLLVAPFPAPPGLPGPLRHQVTCLSRELTRVAHAPALSPAPLSPLSAYADAAAAAAAYAAAATYAAAAAAYAIQQMKIKILKYGISLLTGGQK